MKQKALALYLAFASASLAVAQLPEGTLVDEFNGGSLSSTYWVLASGLTSENVGLAYTNSRISYDWNQLRKIGRLTNLTGVSLKWSTNLPSNQPWTVLAKSQLDMLPGWDGGPFGAMGMPRFVLLKFFIGLEVREGHAGFLPGFDAAVGSVLAGCVS